MFWLGSISASGISTSVVALGHGEGIYLKQRLVPFGEYFPVPPAVREWMKMQNLPHSDLAAGEDIQPLLTAANWGGHGLHARGNFEGYYRSATADKWLEAHGIEHWTHFYTDYGREL